MVELYDGDTAFELVYSFVNSNGVMLPGYTSFDPEIIGQYGKITPFMYKWEIKKLMPKPKFLTLLF